ncbi:MAG: hypothetical protein LQ351_004083 [Letrouitia transgressa]|nr:MAG: hypothetical protein LQ351_004083 [Letrouitia transgressa]
MPTLFPWISIILLDPVLAQISRSGWTAWADSFEHTSEDNSPANAIDGTLDTFWHTQFSPDSTPFPHNITIDMKRVYNVSALRYTPRRTGSMNGNIGSFNLQRSLNGTNYLPPYSEDADISKNNFLNFPDTRQEHDVYFAIPEEARFLRINIFSEAGGRGPWASAAEINVFEAGMQITAPFEPVTEKLVSGGEGGGSHTGEIVGGLLGGISALLTLSFTIYLKCVRERRRRREQDEPADPSGTT